MPRRQQPGRDLIGEDVRRPDIRDVSIETIELREAAAEHHHIRVETIDDDRERARRAS